MAFGKQQLKQIFVDQSGVLKPEEFDLIVKAAGENRQPLDQMLMERGFVAPHHFLSLLADYFKVPSTELKIPDIDLEALNKISEKFAATHLVVPFAQDKDIVKVAMVDPSDEEVKLALEQAVGTKIQPFVATEHAVKRALVLYRGSMKDMLDKVLVQIKNAEQGKGDADTDVETLLSSILESGVLMDASDIHIEPFETEIIIRFRVDGLLKTVAILPASLYQKLEARIKVLAVMKLDEKRLPQDGRFSLKIGEDEVSFRVSTVPSMWGEKVVMRILRKEGQLFDLGNIGFLESDLGIIRRYLKKPFGMILVCGPTGSGKSSTLYAFLEEIGIERVDMVNMSTIEDPIEYTIPRVTQIQIHPEINLTFASGLRSLLRQDPDIIMVGEIRDKETADIAVRGALVGRLLLSSLHTNDAIGAIPRLVDMEVEPYMVGSTLALVVAQRLVRKICPNCREGYKPEAGDIANWKKNQNFDYALEVLRGAGVISKTAKESDLRFYKSKGCAKCDNTGYLGRTAVFEVLEITDDLRALISAKENSVKLKEMALKNGMKTMFADGLAKTILGITDINEVLRVTL